MEKDEERNEVDQMRMKYKPCQLQIVSPIRVGRRPTIPTDFVDAATHRVQRRESLTAGDGEWSEGDAPGKEGPGRATMVNGELRECNPAAAASASAAMGAAGASAVHALVDAVADEEAALRTEVSGASATGVYRL